MFAVWGLNTCCFMLRSSKQLLQRNYFCRKVRDNIRAGTLTFSHTCCGASLTRGSSKSQRCAFAGRYAICPSGRTINRAGLCLRPGSQDDASSYKTSNPRAGSLLAVRTLSPGLSSRGPSRSRREDHGCLFCGITLQKSEPWVMLGLEFFPARSRIKF